VCINSWHAGFKPVLIILEDHIKEEKTKREVSAAIWNLERYCYSRGLLQRGPVLISSKSDSCIIQFDRHDHVVNVWARTNCSSIHTTSQHWQLFKGPALVIDFPAGNDGCVLGALWAQRSSTLSAQLIKMKRERVDVVSSKFWCTRFDPERVPYWTTTYSAMIANAVFGTLQMTLLTALRKFQHGSATTSNLHRCLGDAVVEIPCGISLASFFASVIGMQVPPDQPSRFTIAIGVAFWIIQCIVMLSSTGDQVPSDYVCSNISCFCFFPAIVACAKFRSKIYITWHMLKWYAAVIVGSFGAWNNVIFLLVIYLNILDASPMLASLFLSTVFATQEALVVKAMTVAYSKLVTNTRRTNPMAIIGDQKVCLAFCILCTHTFTELGRLLCITVGAIQADEWSFIAVSFFSLCCTCVVNCLFRTFWFECFLVGCLPHPRVKRLCCPTSIDALHNDTKFAMNWLKFAPVWGLFLGRGLIHGVWSGHSQYENVPLQNSKVWCFNSLVFLTVLMSMTEELVEDSIVHYLQKARPAPIWKVFGEQMIERFDQPEHEDVFHPDHLLVPAEPSREDAGDPDISLQSACKTRRELAASVRKNKKSILTGLSRLGCCLELLPPLTASPNLKHVRTFHTMQLQAITGASVVLATTVLSVGLGNGVLYGHCLPSDLARHGRWFNLLVFQQACPEM